MYIKNDGKNLPTAYVLQNKSKENLHVLKHFHHVYMMRLHIAFIFICIYIVHVHTTHTTHTHTFSICKFKISFNRLSYSLLYFLYHSLYLFRSLSICGVFFIYLSARTSDTKGKIAPESRKRTRGRERIYKFMYVNRSHPTNQGGRKSHK